MAQMEFLLSCDCFCVSSQYFNLFDCFLMMIHWISKEAFMLAKKSLCFDNIRI